MGGWDVYLSHDDDGQSSTLPGAFTVNPTVTASAPGGHGYVEPVSQAVDYGGTAIIDIHPDTGYHISSIVDNGIPQAITDTYTIAGTVANHDVVVAFDIDQLTVSASCPGGHGSLDPATQAVDYGGNAVIGINPDTGYHVSSISDNGAVKPVSNPYVVGTVTADHDVVVTFDKDTFSVGASVSGGHGSLDPAAQTIDYGGNAVIDINPDTGYHISSISDNGAVKSISNPYVIEAVTADHGVVVTFEKDTSTWYLAEGCTAEGMETWILVENPNPYPVKVNLSFYSDEGLFVPADLQGLELHARTRVSINAGEYITSYNVSSVVSSEGGEVICERACYGNNRTWAHDSVGTVSPAPTWYLAEGSTKGGMETWILVMNPNPDPVEVELKFQTEAGGVQGPTETIPAHSRRTYEANDYVDSYDVSTVVSASAGVVCERSMYGGGRTWAHDSIGFSP